MRIADKNVRKWTNASSWFPDGELQKDNGALLLVELVHEYMECKTTSLLFNFAPLVPVKHFLFLLRTQATAGALTVRGTVRAKDV